MLVFSKWGEDLISILSHAYFSVNNWGPLLVSYVKVNCLSLRMGLFIDSLCVCFFLIIGLTLISIFLFNTFTHRSLQDKVSFFVIELGNQLLEVLDPSQLNSERSVMIIILYIYI